MTESSFFKELKRRNVFRVGIAYVVTSWLILQVADIVLDNIAAPEWLMQGIMLILVIGFPLALLFAWAYELTPEGLKKEKDVDRSKSITHHTGHKLDRTIIVILVIALGYFAWDKFHTPSAPVTAERADAISGNENVSPGKAETSHTQAEAASGAPAQRSIAVLPFVDMSPAKDNEYFTDGLTEELLNILAQIKSLQVAGRTSSFAFKGKSEDLREIGSQLNVNTLLEGSVRKDDKNQRIRVTVQLINVEDGYHIWSDTYDRKLEDIFAIQEDIAHQVAEALKINLLGEEEKQLSVPKRTGMTAYDLYLQGLQSLNHYSFESLREAERLFLESLAIDPDYLPTRLALARSLVDQAQTGAVLAPEAFARANPLLDRILAEDPGNSDAHGLKGYIQDYEGDYTAARASYEQAVELAPRNAFALTKYGRFLFDRGQVEEGLSYLQQASRIEPYDMSVQWELCITSAMLVDVPAATRECNRIGEIQPGNPMQAYGQAFIYLFRGEFAQYVYWNSKAMEADPDDPELPSGNAVVWMDLGDMEQAAANVQKAASLEPEHPYVIAARVELLLQQEQYQQAVDQARKAYDANLPNRQGSNDIMHRLLVDDAVRKHDYERALGILRGRLNKAFASPLETDDIDDVETLASMAAVLKLKDPASQMAPSLLDRAQVLNEQYDARIVPFGKPFRQALIESARGNKADAISALHESIEKGWRWGWRDYMLQDFRFEPLHTEPEFKKLVAQLEEDMQTQREEAYVLLGLTP